MKKVLKKNAIEAFKVMNPDMTCRGFQYEIGKSYKTENSILCSEGFHACLKVQDCFSYYAFDPLNVVTKVLLWGFIDGPKEDCSKIAGTKIKVVEKLSWEEVLVLANIGNGNTGHSNTGDRNTGHSNTGDRNTGDRNTGDRNTGHSNTGDRNTGNWNTGDRNTGFLNTNTPNIRIFNKVTDILQEDLRFPKFFYFGQVLWVAESQMSEEEKKHTLSIKLLGGM